MKKKVVFGDKNLGLCLLHKIKSFDLKSIISVFLRTNFFFWFVKDQIYFMIIRKMVFLITKKSDLFLCCKRMKKDFF